MLELEKAFWGSGDVKEDGGIVSHFMEGLYKNYRCLPEAGGGAGLEPNLRGGDRGRGGDKACSRLGTPKISHQKED